MTAKMTIALKIFRLVFLTLIVSRSLYSCIFTPLVPPPALFTPAALPADYSVPPAAVAEHLRIVTLNPALLKQGPFSLTFFDATKHIALLDRVEEQAGSFTWIGHVQGRQDSQIKFQVQDQVIHGVIQFDHICYELQPFHDNLYTFYERNMAA